MAGDHLLLRVFYCLGPFQKKVKLCGKCAEVKGPIYQAELALMSVTSRPPDSHTAQFPICASPATHCAGKWMMLLEKILTGSIFSKSLF